MKKPEKNNLLDDLDQELSDEIQMSEIPIQTVGSAWRLHDGTVGKFEWEDETKQKVIWVPEHQAPVGDRMLAMGWAMQEQKQLKGGFDPVAPAETGQPSLPFPGLIDKLLEVSKYYGSQILEEKTPVIMGQDILTIKGLTGKAEKQAKKALADATVEMMDKASPDCFYIPGNVASSKNSKEIGFFWRKNPETGKNEKVNTLVDSAVTQKYRRKTSGRWLQNKVAFLNQTRNLRIPLMLEFTFIRDSMRTFDFINAAQVLCDLMKDNGYIPDDDTIHICPVFNPVVYYHQELAGVLIKVIK